MDFPMFAWGGHCKISLMTCVTLAFDLLTWNWCVTHCPFMGSICATYEKNRSNRHRVTERTPQKLNDPCDLDLWTWKWCSTYCPLMNFICALTWKWCTTHHSLMGCICATYEANLSKYEQSRHRKKFEPHMWPLTFDQEMVHNTSSPHELIVFMPQTIIQIGHIGTERTQKLRMTHFTWTFDLWIWKWCTTHWPLWIVC